MKELLDKLSSYNLFNYLLPGTIFVASAERMTAHRFSQSNIVVELFVYYFVGLVISRFGSLAVSPLFQWIRFTQFAPYKDFINACTHDAKIELLSEQNNVYRTLCALFVALPVFKALDVLALKYRVGGRTALLVIFVGLSVLFAFAYRKQTSFVRKRVEATPR